VPGQIAAADEALLTVLTDKRLLSCVNSDVSGQILAAGETLVTVRTNKRLLSRVDPHGPGEFTTVSETFSPLRPGEWLTSRVLTLVPLKVLLSSESLAAGLALEGTLAGVGSM